MPLTMTEWRDVPGFGGKYQTTADGRIRLCREIQPVRQRHGYTTVQIFAPGSKRPKVMSLHRLVAMTWVPNPDKHPIVNHIDGDRANAAASNLEWCTYAHNAKHAWLSGRMVTPTMRAALAAGKRAFSLIKRKLSTKQLAAARQRVAAGEQQQAVAKDLRVSEATLSHVLRYGYAHPEEKPCQ